MVIGKKEKVLLLILGVLVYVLVFVKFILIPVIPQIETIHENIGKAQKEKDTLDNDLKSLNIMTDELEAKKMNNEKLQSYLLENADVTESIDYIDKLSQILGKIESIRISKPEEKTTNSSTKNATTSATANEPTNLTNDASKATTSNSNNSNTENPAGTGSKYYVTKLDFTTKLNYADAYKLLEYLEGNSLKVAVSKFTMVPIGTEKSETLNMLEPQGNKNEVTKPGELAEGNTKPILFNINITINLYSLNLNSSDKLFEYSRSRLNRYENKDGVLFSPSIELVNSQNQALKNSTLTNNNTATDITINEKSYFAAGPNLQIFGLASGSDVLGVKSDKKQDITVTLDTGGFMVETVNEGGEKLSLTGLLPQNDATMSVNMNLSDIPENKNIRLNIRIVNNSDKKLRITTVDKEKRTTITDRRGNTIFGNSSAEKVTIT